MHAGLLRLDVLKVRDAAVGFHVRGVLVLLVLVPQKEERVLGHAAPRVDNLVQVQRKDHEQGPLERQCGEHRAKPVAGVVAEVRPRHAAGAKAGGNAGIVAVFGPSAVEVPDGEERDEVFEVVGDGQAVEEVARVPREVCNQRHDDDKEGCRDGRGPRKLDDGREQEGKRNGVVHKEDEEDKVHARIRPREDANGVARGQRGDGPDQDKEEDKDGVDGKPEEVVDEPVGRGAQAHHAHHDAELHLLLVHHGRDDGGEEQEHGNGEEKGPERPANVQRELVAHLGHLLEAHDHCSVLLGVAAQLGTEVGIEHGGNGLPEPQHRGGRALGANAGADNGGLVEADDHVDLGSARVLEVVGQHVLVHVRGTTSAKLVEVARVGLCVHVCLRRLLAGGGVDAVDLQACEVADALQPAIGSPHGRAVLREEVEGPEARGGAPPAGRVPVARLVLIHVLDGIFPVLYAVQHVLLGPPQPVARGGERGL
mmetsp:Transcript_33878/g.66059  ORF Transcript_33878/g.66059 Transcript_33878/m.66059 type:complete len:481 (+) Transcript_33878:1415-2857(+)